MIQRVKFKDFVLNEFELIGAIRPDGGSFFLVHYKCCRDTLYHSTADRWDETYDYCPYCQESIPEPIIAYLKSIVMTTMQAPWIRAKGYVE